MLITQSFETKDFKIAIYVDLVHFPSGPAIISLHIKVVIIFLIFIQNPYKVPKN